MTIVKGLSERQENVHEGLKEKSFGIKDIKKLDDKNVRQLRYWIELGLLGESTHNAVGQDKFNFYEFIWILIIRELKGLNFDNEIIKRCAKGVFCRPDSKYKMLVFEKAILFTLMNRKDSFFVMSKSGEFEVYRPDDLSKIAEKNRFETCVIMNILPLVKGFLYLGDFIGYVTEHELLKENELRALQILHSSKEASITIELSKKTVTVEPGKDAVLRFIDTVFTDESKKISIQL
jgi:hypothetical protein